MCQYSWSDLHSGAMNQKNDKSEETRYRGNLKLGKEIDVRSNSPGDAGNTLSA